ncbi:MAG: hypothetical protein ACK4NF_06505 [Planctomycetota bacterium]
MNHTILKSKKISFVFYLLLPSFIVMQDISIKRNRYDLDQGFSVLYSRLTRNFLYIIATKNRSDFSKTIPIVFLKFVLLDNSIRLKKKNSKKFRNLKDIQIFLSKQGITSKIIGNSLYGDYSATYKEWKVPVVNFSKLIKQININNSKYIITQTRSGDINNIKDIQTKIIISKDDKIVFEKKYPLMVPFSVSKIHNDYYVYLCYIKLGLLKSTIEYIFNKGLSLHCSCLSLNTLKEDKLLTTYFDPEEFGNIMRGIPIVYGYGVDNKEVDRIIVVLRKKKLILNFCKKDSNPCEIIKKTSVDIEFPKLVLTAQQSSKNLVKLLLIYQSKIEVLTISF